MIYFTTYNLQVQRHGMEIVTGYNTFKHEHDAAKRPRDYKRLFGQKKVGPLCWKLVAENNREYSDFDWLLPLVESVNIKRFHEDRLYNLRVATRPSVNGLLRVQLLSPLVIYL